MIGDGEHRKHGSPLPFDVRHPDTPTQVVDSLKALNQLAGAKFANFDMQQPHRPPTKVQVSMVQRLCRTLDECGGQPAGLDGPSSVAELMRSFAPYDGMPNHLIDYDFDKIKILKSEVKPKRLIDLLPPKVRPFISDFKHHVERDPVQVRAELSQDPNAMPKHPYWDPTLRSDQQERLRLFKRMFDIGLVDLQPSIRARAGIFFVKKKDPRYIRLIIDGRQANYQHRRPPVTRLGSAACLAELRLPAGQASGSAYGFGQEMDVSDAFYQFRVDEAGAWFGLDQARSYDQWKSLGFVVDTVFDYNLGARRLVRENERLFPVVSAMSMGWSWALFLANETISAIVRESSPHPSAELREKLPVPSISDFDTISSTYVDNVTIIGASQQQVKDRVALVDAAFKKYDIPVVWTQEEPVQCFESVGCVVDFGNGRVSNKASRLWRVHLAALEIIKRSKVRVEIIEIWLGHITSLFRLRPCLLSIFDKIYRFVAVGRGKRIALWPSVKREMRLAAHLVWFTHVDMQPQLIQQVDAGDSADHGYALMTMVAASYQIERAIRYKERWRFIPLPSEVKDVLESGDRARLEQLLTRSGGSAHERAELWTQAESGFAVSGLGLDTPYGRWLQTVLEDGDWLKTSAIKSQWRAKGRHRADIDFPALVEPVDAYLLNPAKYKLLWAKRWRDPTRHINYKEALVALSSLKRTTRVDSLGSSLKLTLCDNLSVVLAFEKGRSQSPALNRLCRISASLQIAANVFWKLRHIESPRNVADTPSRMFEKNRLASVQWIDMKHVRGVPVLELESCFRKYSPSSPPGLSKINEDDHVSEASETIRRSTSCGSHRARRCDHSDSSRAHQQRSSDTPHDPISGNSGEAVLNREVRDVGDRRERLQGSMLEVFSGSGNLSTACDKAGIGVAGSLDIRNGTHYDLTRSSTQNFLAFLVGSGLFSYIHFGTPCTVFSIARKGLRNMQVARYKEKIACELAFFTAKLVELCCAVGTFWSIENPCSSMLWDLFPIRILFQRSDVFVIDFPMCAYGAPYKKMTRILTNCSHLASLARSCIHKRHSEQLSGKVSYVDKFGNKQTCNRTEFAGSYPKRLAETWASLLKQAIQPCHDQEKLSAISRAIEEELVQVASYTIKNRVNQFQLWDSVKSGAPSLLQSICFGQDSQAEKARKRQKRQRASGSHWRAWESTKVG